MDISTILRQHDRQSFDWLYDHYAGLLLSRIRRMTGDNSCAETLLLETYVTAWKSLDEFEGDSRGLLIWMLQIARIKAAERNRHEPSYDRSGINEMQARSASFQRGLERDSALTGGEKQSSS